jgi:hypothetical protein
VSANSSLAPASSFLERAGTDERITVRRGEPTARLSGPAWRTSSIRLRAPGCGAGRGDWAGGSCRDGSPYALRVVSLLVASRLRPHRTSSAPNHTPPWPPLGTWWPPAGNSQWPPTEATRRPVHGGVTGAQLDSPRRHASRLACDLARTAFA